MTQQKITEEQRATINALAAAFARADIIDVKIDEMGYGTYLTRRDRGGMMPASFDRIYDRARESARDDLKCATVEPHHVEHAMYEMGLYTDRDRDWSHRVAGWCDWDITAPDGWGA